MADAVADMRMAHDPGPIDVDTDARHAVATNGVAGTTSVRLTDVAAATTFVRLTDVAAATGAVTVADRGGLWTVSFLGCVR